MGERPVYLREVHESRRRGRGRWWCPNGAGYTDIIRRAGLYVEPYHHNGEVTSVPAVEYLRGEVDALTRLLREAEALAVVPDTDTEVDRARALVFRWIDHGRDGDPDCAACGGSGSALVDEEPGQRTFKMCPCQDRIAEARDLVGWDGTWGLEDRKP